MVLSQNYNRQLIYKYLVRLQHQYTYPECGKTHRLNQCGCRKNDHQRHCGDNKNQKEKSFWSNLFGRGRKRRPPLESCRLYACQLQAQNYEHVPSFVRQMKKEFGEKCVKVERTKGPAYIFEIQHDHKPHEPKSKSDILIEKIERNKSSPYREDICNPMPSFTTVGQRLIDLTARKLHPLYRKYESVPKRTGTGPKPDCNSIAPYRYTESTTQPEQKPEPPKQITIEPKEKNNQLIDYKITQLPKSMVNRLKSAQLNCVSPLETRSVRKRVCKNKMKHLMKCPPEEEEEDDEGEVVVKKD